MEYGEGIIACEDGEVLEEISKRSCGCPIPENVKGQFG